MAEMRTLCSLSVAEGAAFVALCKEKDDAIVGLAYYRFDPNHSDENPEFAIDVEDHFQGSGLGKVLLTHLCRHAETGGFCGLNATIHYIRRSPDIDRPLGGSDTVGRFFTEPGYLSFFFNSKTVSGSILVATMTTTQTQEVTS